MWTQFFLENIHFALNLFAALVLFLTGWLYFDAWLIKKGFRDIFKIAGFALLTVSFLAHATSIESTILESSILGTNLEIILVTVCRILGYLLLIIGLTVDPLQAHIPLGLSSKQKLRTALLIPSSLFLSLVPVSFPILAVVVAFLYLRRATVGLEGHLKSVSLAFYILALHELLALSKNLQNTSNVDLYNLVAPFGPLWLIEHAVLFVAVVILGRWVYYYLVKRLQTQLFMISTASVLVIFLITTTTFTGLLLKSLEDETLSQLETNVKVLNYAVDSKKAESLSDTQVLAQDPQIISAVESKDKLALSKTAESFLLTKKQNFLVIVSDTGQVLARGEDKERIGDSIADDPQIQRALVGEANTSVGTKDGVLGPEVSVRAASPVKSGEGTIIGAILSGTAIDNAFVDGIKAATGLEAAIYGDNILSATTLLSSDGTSRYIGVKEENSSIKDKVLTKGENYSGAINLLNTPYFAAYLPLKDVDTNPVGMLFVGKRQVGVLQTAGKSIEFTFLVAVALLVLSIIPAFLVARFISSQIR